MVASGQVLAQGQAQRYSCRVTFESEPAYLSYLRENAVVPRGFSFSVGSLSFTPAERPDAGAATMNLSTIESDIPATLVGVTTRNRFCGAPVSMARERIAAGALRGIVINNKVANVGSVHGLDDAGRIAAALAARGGYRAELACSVSTGVIGWRVPVAALEAAVPELVPTRDPVAVAQAMMTTDRYPKLAWNTTGDARCLGVAKGAGMIEPRMATMLGFLMLDARVERSLLDRVFRAVVACSFNRISVDSDQSTSDMVLCLANGAGGVSIDDPQELEALLQPVCDTLAEDIVRNGEGTAHVLELRVRLVGPDELALGVARHIANSPLVKTAIYGNDPNVGRILAALGDALSTLPGGEEIDMAPLRVRILDTEVFRDGGFRLDGTSESRLAEGLAAAGFDPAQRGFPASAARVPILVDLAPGDAAASEARVLGSDLSYEYIRENADYRT
mgnify:CR=1 FL=1